MKYIRTSENKIEQISDEFALFCKDHANNRQADTIKDLCDRFVIYCKPNYYEVHEDFEEVRDWLYAENITAIFGAIFTDKGLIYVAKMNDKGELKLL